MLLQDSLPQNLKCGEHFYAGVEKLTGKLLTNHCGKILCCILFIVMHFLHHLLLTFKRKALRTIQERLFLSAESEGRDK